MSAPFTHHADAARALIASGADIGRKAGGFCGQIIFDPVLSERQRKWLETLLERSGLPPLQDGGGS
ncbi:MAG TPA: hypothetical protein VF631_10945 [Allosphingosinicella sp.]|jgi:hypothetical protein|uniref:hypothetical protein n=1 Tax=Allosphingosinicella sp. TaxID=2823234 RepID=UPI002F28AD28